MAGAVKEEGDEAYRGGVGVTAAEDGVRVGEDEEAYEEVV